MMFVLKLICMLVGGAGLVFGTICWTVSWMDCGDEITGAVGDGCVSVACVSAAIYFGSRCLNFISAAF